MTKVRVRVRFDEIEKFEVRSFTTEDVKSMSLFSVSVKVCGIP